MPDQEHRPRHDEGNEDRDRRVVEEVEVVDEQDQAVVAGEAPQLGPGGVEQTGALVVTDAEVGGEVGRQQVGQRPERDLPGRRVADGPLDPAAAALGQPQGLLGQARLAHAGRPVEDDAGARGSR